MKKRLISILLVLSMVISMLPVSVFADEVSMDENKEYILEKLDYFKKLKEDPNFLGYIVNIARVSYIINITLL